MNELEKIRQPIKSELKEFEKYFRSSVKSTIPFLDKIIHHILRRKGKQIRPTFVLLTSAMVGQINKSSYIAASLIELLHTASLIHDDVVDESYERRGFFSIKALWRSKIAVLVGDYMLSRGLLLSVEHKEYDLLEIVSEAVRDMSEGELLQIRKSRKLNITMPEYFDVITKKTAALISACTAAGARAHKNDPGLVNKMKQFGLYVGIAFQIKDDLFDYQRNGNLGKPTANDIKEKKMTLPLIYTLESCTTNEKKDIIRILRKQNINSVKVDRVFDYVDKYKGLDFASNEMYSYRDRAIKILEEFPENEAKRSLISLVNFTVDRKK